MSLRKLQFAIWVLASVVGPCLGRPQTLPTTTTVLAPENTTSLVLATTNATVQFYPDTATSIATSVITAVTRPPGTILSVVTMITTKTVTSLIPGPITEYPATLTKTVISTATIEYRSTNSDGKKSTSWKQVTDNYPLTTTVQDPNPPPPTDTDYGYPSDFTFPFPSFENPTDESTTDEATSTGTETVSETPGSTTPPPVAPVPTTTATP